MGVRADADGGPISVCHTTAPVTAFSAYKNRAPDTYTVETPVTGSGSIAAVAVIPGGRQVTPAGCRAHGSTPPRRWTRSARRPAALGAEVHHPAATIGDASSTGAGSPVITGGCQCHTRTGEAAFDGVNAVALLTESCCGSCTNWGQSRPGPAVRAACAAP
jgi:hypothetical protein